MVERSLSMREVPGSIPGASIHFWLLVGRDIQNKAMSRLFSKRTFLDLVTEAKLWTHKWMNEFKNMACIVRELNPGRPRGRRPFYHWTNDACLLQKATCLDRCSHVCHELALTCPATYKRRRVWGGGGHSQHLVYYDILSNSWKVFEVNKKLIRSRQDSNLRSQRESDF